MELNEAYSIVMLEDEIKEKAQGLAELEGLYSDNLKRYNTFINEYTKSLNSFIETLNKRLEEMYNLADSFNVSYNNDKEAFLVKKKEILAKNEANIDNKSIEIELNLINKLEEEIKALTKEKNEIIDNYIKEFNKAQESLNKSISKLNKLKSLELKK